MTLNVITNGIIHTGSWLLIIFQPRICIGPFGLCLLWSHFRTYTCEYLNHYNHVEEGGSGKGYSFLILLIIQLSVVNVLEDVLNYVTLHTKGKHEQVKHAISSLLV